MPITNRTLLYEIRSGNLHWHDWALVTTALGAMVEPRTQDAGVEHANEDRDQDEVMSLVTDLRAIPRAVLSRKLGGGDFPLHGGDLRGRA